MSVALYEYEGLDTRVWLFRGQMRGWPAQSAEMFRRSNFPNPIVDALAYIPVVDALTCIRNM